MHSILHSPFNNTLADYALNSACTNLSTQTIHYSYLSRGSDERQYCSPSFRLPLCNYSRSLFGNYPEYHTSADNLLCVSERGLQSSFLVLKSIIDAFELGLYPYSLVSCEPQLGKRGLYKRRFTSNSADVSSRRLLDILAYCDGTQTIFEIALVSQLPLGSVVDALSTLLVENIIGFKHCD